MMNDDSVRVGVPIRTVPPAILPVTIEQMRAQSRIDFPDDDALLTGYIEAAVSHLDGYSGILGRAMITQTWAVSYSSFPGDVLRLPLGRLIAVSSVQWVDAAGATQTLAGMGYRPGEDAAGPYLRRVPATSWPVSDERDDAVTVTWTCGYGAAAADVPPALRHAIMLLAAHYYEHRMAAEERPRAEIPYGVEALITPFRVRHV